MNLSPYLANKIARWIAGNNMPAAPGTVYLALFDGNPLGSGVEIGALITGGAARIAIPHTDPADNGFDSLFTNNADIDFGNSAHGGSLILDNVAIYDAVSLGNCLLAGELPSPKTVNPGDSVKVSTGNLDVTILKTT